MSRLFFLVALGAILTLGASRTDADARPGYEVRPAGVKLVLSGGHRSDYVVSVSADERQRVQVQLDGLSATVEYSTKGRVSSQRVQATFGALGRVNVELDITRHRADPSLRGLCKGRGARYQEGTYRGEIKFPRQGNLPRVSISEGRVYIKRRFRRVCKRQRLHHQSGGKAKLKKRTIEVGILTVSGKSEGRTVFLEALDFAMRRNPSRSGGRLAVEVYERRARVRITRSTNLFIDHTSVAMSRHGEIPETVEVYPPEPFAGDALYSRSLNASPSWAGDLSVDLPGANEIPLTGLGFSVVLCRSSWMARFARCHSDSGASALNARPLMW
jgi:hypothetical protein